MMTSRMPFHSGEADELQVTYIGQSLDPFMLLGHSLYMLTKMYPESNSPSYTEKSDYTFN